MKNLYVSSYNARMDEENGDFTYLYKMVTNLSLDYDRIIVNVSSKFEMSLFKYLKDFFRHNFSAHDVISSEELETKYSEEEYDACVKALKDISPESPKVRADIVMSTLLMNNGVDILLLNDKGNRRMVNFALAYARQKGVHSYVIDIETANQEKY